MIMEGEAMVAVVRGLGDSGLAVTLLDSGRQYTLVPEAASQPAPMNISHTTGSQCLGEAARESSVQATDGRYASTYKMMHCHVTPTSPPDLVTEFPPQRSEILPGYGNFEVGGRGSGENHGLPTRSNGFRGAMCWPDRGAIFSPRPCIQPDSFANSLRKYPPLAQERSSEIVERLINFTQTKNSNRNRSTSSPTRNIDSDFSMHTVPLEASRKINGTQRSEESPTKDRTRIVLDEREPLEPWRRSTFSKTNDPNHQPERLVLERFDSPSADQRRSINPCSAKSVNMEIQAAVQMVSREIVTMPRIKPSQRTVAVPLTPTPSFVFARKSESSVAYANLANLDTTKHFTEFVQKNLDPVDINIQTALSTIEISNHKCRHRKRSKSQDEIRFNESMKNEILHFIQRLPLDSNYCAHCRSHRKSHKTFSLKRIEDTKHICNSRERKLVRDFSKVNPKYFKRLAKTFQPEVSAFGMIKENELAELLQDWINLIPFKGTDSFRINVDKESLFYELFEYISNGEYSLKGFDKGYNLKNEILNKLESIPLEVKGFRWVYENKLADILVNNLNKIGRIPADHFLLDEGRETRSHKLRFKIKCPSTHKIKKFVLKELSIFLQKSDSRLNQRQIKEVEDELIDSLSVSVALLRGAREKYLIMNIIELLVNYGVPEYKAIYFSNTLIRRFREVFRGEEKIRSETFIVLSSTETVQANGNATSNSLSIKSINEDDIQANVDAYTKDLCREIDDWLKQLPVSISQDEVLREVAANDLASDIVSRQKYIELNSDSSRTSETELEHLKDQILKWINKFVVDENLETSRYVPDLMSRINNISVPMLSRLQDLQKGNVDNSKASSTIHFETIPPYEKTLILKNQPPLNAEEEQQTTQLSIRDDNDKVESNYSQNSEQCCSSITRYIAKTDDELQEEYVKYVKDWVKLIPIEAKTPEEQDIADKARLGIHNGIWKIVTKLDCDPATYNNRFFYEDLFDEEIDSLLDCLPQTPELQSKKHLLKAQLIEKTSDINELIRSNEELSFRYNLVKNIFSSLRQLGIPRGNDSVQMYENMQAKKIVDEFLLCTSFKSNDKVKAEIYKKKLIKHIEHFIDYLKEHHSDELKNVNISLHKVDIINILLRVRLPGEAVIKQEADSILLDLEIEQWYSDLPNVPINDYKEQYQRSKQREFLVKKVKEFENNSIDFSESALRLEVFKFLEKAPLKEGENLNISFMVEQFINRIKNRPKQETTQMVKKVAFQTIPNYEDFSKDISLCSSFIHPPKITAPTQKPAHDDDKNETKKELINNSKLSAYNASSQSRINTSGVVIDDQPTLRTFNEGRPMNSTFHSERSNQEEAQPTSDIKMFTIPPYRTPKQNIPQRREHQILQLPEENVFQKSFYVGRPVSSTFDPEKSNGQRHTLEEAEASPNIKMYTIPPHRSPEQRISQGQDQQFLQLPEENVYPKSFYVGRPVGATFNPEKSGQQWHTLEEAQPISNIKMFDIPPYRRPEQRISQGQDQQFLQLPEENVYPKSFYVGRPVGATFNPEKSGQQWHTLEEAQPISNIKMFDIPPYRRPEQRISQGQDQQFLQLPEENVYPKSFYVGRPVGATFNPEKSGQQWHTLEEAQPISNIKMFDIPPYRSPEQRIPQRQEHLSLQRPQENKTIGLDYGSGTDQKQSTKVQLYQEKGKENYPFERIKSSKGILGTSQIAGPSGYSSKFSENVNNNYYKPETYEPPPRQLPDPPLYDLRGETKLYGEQIPQTYNIPQPDSLRKDNLMQREDKQNAATNTSYNPAIYSSTPPDIYPNITACTNLTRDDIAIEDKRRYFSLVRCEEDDDTCRCIEKYFKRSKMYPCENYNNYPPYINMFLPYRCFM